VRCEDAAEFLDELCRCYGPPKKLRRDIEKELFREKFSVIFES
jgi:hypothetical protein